MAKFLEGDFIHCQVGVSALARVSTAPEDAEPLNVAPNDPSMATVQEISAAFRHSAVLS